MVNADTRAESIVKILLALIFGVFCITQFLAQKTDSHAPVTYPAEKRYGVVITGGSNALFGVAVSEMPEALGPGFNLSLPSEGKSNLDTDYISWLKQAGVRTPLAIDSPVSFWWPETIRPGGFNKGRHKTGKRNLLPEKSLLRALIPLQTVALYEKDVRGDLARHHCDDGALLIPLALSSERLRRIAAASGYFARRLSSIRTATHARTAVLRVPPMFVSEATRQRVEPVLKNILADFRAQGIPVLQQQAILTTDRALFCDDVHHPNAEGRTLFTTDLVRALEKQSAD